MQQTIQSISSWGGRILVALPALVFGVFHFGGADKMAGMVPVTGGVFWVYFTGIALIAGAIGIFVKKFSTLAAFLLGVLFLVFALTIHLPGLGAADAGMQQMSMMNLLKDLGMAGGAWALAAFLATQGE